MRVTSKLRPCDGQWMVSVVMEDDSGGQLNVNLSNQVCMYVHTQIYA